MMGLTFVLKKMTKGKRIGKQIHHEMQKETPVAAISLGVAAASYFIGIAAKALLGINVS